MHEKKRFREAEIISLPPLRMMLGESNIPNNARIYNTDDGDQKLNPELEGTVKRLIAYFEDENSLK